MSIINKIKNSKEYKTLTFNDKVGLTAGILVMIGITVLTIMA